MRVRRPRLWLGAQLLIAAYAEVGLECLVIWEGDLRRDSEGVGRRVEGFVVSVADLLVFEPDAQGIGLPGQH
mgnify:CR=1 FL=1